MEMSATRVFVLVEGRAPDRFFYGEVCRYVLKGRSIPYEVVPAERFADSGGKAVLFDLFKFLASAGSLSIRRRPTTACCIFFLDKDVDDILGGLVRSPHVVYTPFYCIENTIFIHGELVKAAAAASALDLGRVEAGIPDAAAWREQRAEAWKDFVVFCLFVHKCNLHCDCNYGRHTSELNGPADGLTSPEQVAAKENELRRHSGLAPAQFNRKLAAIRRLVNRLYGKGQHDLIFNGKWYQTLLQREIELIAGSDPYSKPGVASGLVPALQMNLIFDQPWALHFLEPLRSLVESL